MNILDTGNEKDGLYSTSSLYYQSDCISYHSQKQERERVGGWLRPFSGTTGQGILLFLICGMTRKSKERPVEPFLNCARTFLTIKHNIRQMNEYTNTLQCDGKTGSSLDFPSQRN